MWASSFGLCYINKAKTNLKVFLFFRLLNTEYEDVRMQVLSKIQQASSLGIIIDGWTNCKRNNIVNILLTTPVPMYLKSIDTKNISHDGAYMSQLVMDVMQEYGSDKFFAICTDNAPNMKKLWRFVSQKFPHIAAYGCLDHCLNLLAEDIGEKSVKEIKTVIDSARSVIKSVTGSNIAYAEFREIQGNIFPTKTDRTSLKLPGNTRFGSNAISLRSLTHNIQVVVTRAFQFLI